VIDVFVVALDLAEMSFEGAEPAATGRPWDFAVRTFWLGRVSGSAMGEYLFAGCSIARRVISEIPIVRLCRLKASV
jgi:hypothetical protein